jgi:hypothetical protein
MATNGSVLVSADAIPIETTNFALPDTLTAPSDLGITPTNVVGPLPDTSTISGADVSIDSTGDEGYVDSAGLLGGGNSTSSNNPDETCPAPGSPVAGATPGFNWEDLTRIAVAGAQVATAIEGPSTRTPTGRTGQSSTYYGARQPSLLQRLFGQSAPVRGSKPSFLQSLLGTTSGATSGVNPSASGMTGAVTILFVGVVILGLGFLVWRAVRA